MYDEYRFYKGITTVRGKRQIAWMPHAPVGAKKGGKLPLEIWTGTKQ
jgi:hypothetical protein